MRAAFLGIDVVDEAVYIFLIAVVVLHRDLDDRIVLDPIEVDRLLVDRLLLAVEVGNEGADAALKMERLAAFLLAALIHERDRNAVVEEGEFAQAVLQRLKAVRGNGEDLRIRNEMHARTRGLGCADLMQLIHCHAARKGNLIDLAVTAHLDLHRGGEGVDDRDADAVETAGDLVAVAAELAARMENSEHDLDRRHAALVHINGNAAAVVRDGDAVVLVDHNLDVVAVARKRLVNRVVNNFINKVMQSALGGRSDVHTRALANSLKALEHLDLSRAVVSIDCSDLVTHLLRADRNTREIGDVRHLSGFFCLLRRERTNLRLLLVCIQVDLLCHHFLLGAIELLI